MNIRDLRPGEYNALIGLWEKAGLSYRPRGRDSRERIMGEMEGGRAFFLVADVAGELIGSVLGTHDGRKGWINRLAVLPEHRRQGVAAALVTEVEARLLQQGIEIVTCLIEGWNRDSMRFFDRIGYVAHPDITYYSKRRTENV